jgi:hypothetical protein
MEHGTAIKLPWSFISKCGTSRCFRFGILCRIGALLLATHSALWKALHQRTRNGPNPKRSTAAEDPTGNNGE